MSTEQGKLQDYAITPVPLEERKGLFDMSVVFGGLSLSVTAWLIGGTIGSGMPLGLGILAILLGNLFLGVYAGLFSMIGMKQGLSTTMISRIAFGKYGQMISSTVMLLFFVGFVGVYAAMMAALINQLLGIPGEIAALVFMILVCATAIYGFKGLTYLSRVGLPALGILVVFGLVQVGRLAGGFGEIWSAVPPGHLGFGAVVSSVIALWIVGATLSADIGRYGRKPLHSFIAPIFAWGICVTLLESTALAAALGAGTGDLVQILVGLNMLLPATVIYLILMWTSADNVLYSFSLALTNYELTITQKLRLGKPFWTVLGSVIALILGIYMFRVGITSAFLGYILVIASAIPPIGGVLLAEYFLRGKFKADPETLVMPIISFSAFIATIIGILVAVNISAGVPALQGMAAAALSYYLIDIAVGDKLKAYAKGVK